MACHGYPAHDALHDVLLGRKPADTAPHGTSMPAQFAASVALSRILAQAGTVPSLILFSLA
ncbi:hypothetical protein ACFYYY_22210 [Streptomyces sp. NPDC001834]|uniref:hypothetical protein n=1 Tax=unclassified Streptomyces TaxID=2593676 RepID=UPI00342A881E